MKSNGLQLFLAVALALPLGHPQAAAPQTAGAAISGSVQLPPAAPKRRSSRGSAYRNRLAPSRDSGTPAPARSPFTDVVVSAHALSSEAAVTPLSAPVRVEQRKAEFIPRVQAITVGSTVEFVNQDRFFHNVFSLSRNNDFDIGRRPTGEVVAQTFATPGVVEIFCDIHPQMSATLLVLNTAWHAQPDSTGGYRITGLPAGRYQVRAYHPEHGSLEAEIAVDAGTEATQAFTFGAR